MRNAVRSLDQMLIKARNAVTMKKAGNDQIIVMFIIIAVAAGIAGLLYFFGTRTLLPNFQQHVTELVDQWFNHA
jgi:hypothetical protein